MRMCVDARLLLGNTLTLKVAGQPLMLDMFSKFPNQYLEL